MDVKLTVLSSRAIQEKKPWPKTGWLQDSKEDRHGLYMFHKSELCQVSTDTGKTSKKFPAISDLEISIISYSPNGVYVAGLLSSGDLFIWNKVSDTLEVQLSPFSKLGDKIKSDVHAYSGYRVFVSDTGEQVFVVTEATLFYLWEASDERSHWWKLFPPAEVCLPAGSQRETALDCSFYVHQVLEEICICGLVFSNRDTKETTIAHVLINWASATAKFYSSRSNHSDEVDEPVLFPLQLFQEASISTFGSYKDRHSISSSTEVIGGKGRKVSMEGRISLSSSCGSQFGAMWSDSPPFRVSWGSISCPSSSSPSHNGSGTYVYRLSPMGDLGAVVTNHKKASKSRIIFFSPLNQVGISVKVYQQAEESWIGRTYWITSVSWTADGLLLACLTKRGSLMIFPRFGPPLLLLSHGCGVDLGPRFSLNLHPLITVTGPSKNLITDHENSESSERDRLRQKFSLSCHPSLPLLVCSDGYNFTLLKIGSKHSLIAMVKSFIAECQGYLDMDKRNISTGKGGKDGNNDDEDDQGLEDSSGLDFRDLVASLDSEPDDSKHKSSLFARKPKSQSSSAANAMNGERFLDKYLKNLDAGRIEFADESQRGVQNSKMNGIHQRSDNSLRQALLYLQSAAGLLLTCDPFVPYRGTWPSSPSPSLPQAEKSREELRTLSLLLLSTTNKVLSQTSLLCAFSNGYTSSEMIVLSLNFTRAVLKLILQDTFLQANTQLSVSLCNAIICGHLSGWFKRHLDFKSQDQSKYTIMSLLEYSNTIGKGMVDFSNLLEDLIHVLLSTYKTYPSIFGHISRMPSSSSFYSSISQPSSNCVLYLSSSLDRALKLVSLLWKDMKTCRSLSSTAGYLPGEKSQGPQLSRKTIIQNISYNTKNVCSTLKALQVYIQQLLAQTDLAGVSPRSECRGSIDADIPVSDSASGTESKAKDLLDYLTNYDILAAVKLADTCIEFMPDENNIHSNVPLDLSSYLSGERSSDEFALSGSSSLRLIRTPDKITLAILGQLMASYFTNRKLLVPRCLGDHLEPSQKTELSRLKVTESLKESGTWEYWTVERTLAFLVLSDKWEEAYQFVLEVEDWRKAFVLAATHSLHHKLMSTSSGPSDGCLFETSYQLGLINTLKVIGSFFHKMDKEKFHKAYRSSHSGVPANLQLRYIEIFLSETFNRFSLVKMEAVVLSAGRHYLCELEEACSDVGVKVASGFQLPAPPLYCPQPAITKEEYVQCPEEHYMRYCIAVTIQRLLFLLKSNKSLLQCAQWYTHCLLSSKLSAELKEVLRVPSAQPVDGETSYLKKLSEQEIGTVPPNFQELCAVFQRMCGLLWMLHIRDNVNYLIRKLQPSISQKPINLSSACEEAASWTARLCPFSDRFPQVPSINQLIFTVLSELQDSKFLADILAYCFPDANQQKDEKFRKIISRLSSSMDAETSEPLSSHYHSRSKLVMDSLKEVYGESNGKFYITEGSDNGERNLSVGNFLFEHDVEYLNFLENVFSVIILPLQGEEPGLSLYSPKSPSNSVHYSTAVSKPGSPATAVFPTINKLIKWARIPPPDITSEDGSRHSSAGGARKVARRRNKLTASSMKIFLSAPVIVSALKQIEEVQMTPEEQNKYSKKLTTGEGMPLMDVASDTGDLKDVRPVMLKGIARDSCGRVYLLQVPEGVLQMSTLTESSGDHASSSTPIGHPEVDIPSHRNKSIEQFGNEQENSTCFSSSGEFPLDATYSCGEVLVKKKSSESMSYDTTILQQSQESQSNSAQGLQSPSAASQDHVINVTASSRVYSDVVSNMNVPVPAENFDRLPPGIEDSVETLTQSITAISPCETLTATLTESGTVTLTESADNTLTEVTHEISIPLKESHSPEHSKSVCYHSVSISPQHDRQFNENSAPVRTSLDLRNSTGKQKEPKKSISSEDPPTHTVSVLSVAPQDLAPTHHRSQPGETVHFHPHYTDSSVVNISAELFPPPLQKPDSSLQQQQQPLIPSSVTYTVNLGPNMILSPSHGKTEEKSNQTELHSGIDTSLTAPTHQASSVAIQTSPTGSDQSQAPHIVNTCLAPAAIPEVPPTKFQSPAVVSVAATTMNPAVTTVVNSSTGVDGLQENIASIVRNEVKATLQEHHEELLSLLKPSQSEEQRYGSKKSKKVKPVIPTMINESANEKKPFVDTSEENSLSSEKSTDCLHKEQTRGTQPLPITDSRLRSKKTKKGKRLLTSTKIHDSKNEAKVFSANIEDNSISSLERPGGIVTKTNFSDLTPSASESILSSRSCTHERDFQMPSSDPSPTAKVQEKQHEQVGSKTKQDQNLTIVDVEEDGNSSNSSTTTTTSASNIKKIVKRVKDGIKTRSTKKKGAGVSSNEEPGYQKRGRPSAMSSHRSLNKKERSIPVFQTTTQSAIPDKQAEPSLEDVFPELVTNLRKFDSSVRPAWKQGGGQTQEKNVPENPVDITGPGIPLFQIPQAASMLPGTPKPHQNQEIDQHLLSNLNQNNREQPPPLLLLQIPTDQQFIPPVQPASSVPAQLQQSSGHHPAFPHQPVVTPSHYSCPHSSQPNVKFPLLLPQGQHEPSGWPHQSSTTPLHFPPVISSSTPSSVPVRASQNVSHSCKATCPVAPPGSRSPPPPPPRLLQVPGLFQTGVLASLLVRPEQLVEQQQEMMSHGNMPQLKADSLSRRTPSTSPVKTSLSPLKRTATGDSKSAELIDNNCNDIHDTSTSTSPPRPLPCSKESTKTAYNKKEEQELCHSLNIEGIAGNKEAGSDSEKPISVATAEEISDGTCETTFDKSDTENNPDAFPTNGFRMESERHGKMKKMLKNAEELSRKLATSSVPEDRGVEHVASSWAEPSGDITNLPERLQPLASLEMRRLNLYKLDPDLKSALPKRKDKRSARGKKIAKDKLKLYSTKQIDRNIVYSDNSKTSRYVNTSSSSSRTSSSMSVHQKTTSGVSGNLLSSEENQLTASDLDLTSVTRIPETVSDSLPASDLIPLEQVTEAICPRSPSPDHSSPNSLHLQLTRSNSSSFENTLTSSQVEIAEDPVAVETYGTRHQSQIPAQLQMSASHQLIPDLSHEDNQKEVKVDCLLPRDDQTADSSNQFNKQWHIDKEDVETDGSDSVSQNQSPHRSSHTGNSNELVEDGRKRMELQVTPKSGSSKSMHELQQTFTVGRKEELMAVPHHAESIEYSDLSEPVHSNLNSDFPGSSLPYIGKPESVSSLDSFRVPSHNRIQRENLSLEMLLRDLKSSSEKKEAMETFLQLEEQLRALHKSVRAMDGGFRQSNKILNTIDHLTESSEAREAPNGTVDLDYHLDSMSVSSDGSHQVAKIYEQFHERGRKERVEFGNVMEMGRYDGGATWTKSYSDDEDDKVVKNEYLEKEGKQTCSRGVSVLHCGQRWNTGELKAWRESKRKNKPQIHVASTRIESGSRKTKDDNIKKAKLESPSPRKLECSKSFLEEARQKRLEEAQILMADIINSQKANTPKTLPQRQHELPGQGSVAKRPTARLQNTTFTANNHNALGRTRSVAKAGVATSAVASKSGTSGHGVTRSSSLLGQGKKPTPRDLPTNTRTRQNSSAASRSANVVTHGATPTGFRKKGRVSFELEKVLDGDKASVTSESIMSNIDWDEVDKILAS